MQIQPNKLIRQFGSEDKGTYTENPEHLDVLLFSDEVHFYSSEHVNKQNFRFGAREQPLAVPWQQINLEEDWQSMNPLSPDLIPSDYLLQGYLKEEVDRDNSNTIDRLNQNF